MIHANMIGISNHKESFSPMFFGAFKQYIHIHINTNGVVQERWMSPSNQDYILTIHKPNERGSDPPSRLAAQIPISHFSLTK